MAEIRRTCHAHRTIFEFLSNTFVCRTLAKRNSQVSQSVIINFLVELTHQTFISPFGIFEVFLSCARVHMKATDFTCGKFSFSSLALPRLWS